MVSNRFDIIKLPVQSILLHSLFISFTMFHIDGISTNKQTPILCQHKYSLDVQKA